MIQLFFSILSYDIWFYISHIMLHHASLYKYHKEHHLKIVPTYLDTYVGHVLEGPYQSIGTFIPFFFLTYSLWDICFIFFFLNMRGMMRHDERFVFLIGNHHLLHHKYPNYNFGEYWLDSLFGTKYPHTQEYRRGWIYI